MYDARTKYFEGCTHMWTSCTNYYLNGGEDGEDATDDKLGHIGCGCALYAQMYICAYNATVSALGKSADLGYELHQ